MLQRQSNTETLTEKTFKRQALKDNQMIKKNIFKGNLKEQLKAAAQDRMYRFMMADKMIRGAIVNCTRMVKEMRANHELGMIETLVLGQAYIAAALLTANLKGKDRVSISIQCSGPVKGLDVESNVFGEVRGFLKNPNFSSECKKEDIKGLPSLFGAGFISVTKYLEKSVRPYSGRVMLEYGTIAEDLANYFLCSEQIPTAFSLSVYFDSSGTVAGAGGIFLQAMPGVDNKIVEKAEDIVKNIKSIGKNFAGKIRPDTLILNKFDDLTPILLDNQRLEFFCRCTEQKMLGYLASLPRKDINDILEKGLFPLEIRCHNCNTLYKFNRSDIESLSR